MKSTFVIFLSAMSVTAFAQTRIQSTDSVGNVQYHKGSHVIQGNTIVKQDSIGNTQYHKQQFVIVGNRIYERSSTGAVQYHKGSAKVSK
jgi:hypothetical protein